MRILVLRKSLAIVVRNIMKLEEESLLINHKVMRS
jgi:hypothetical protein